MYINNTKGEYMNHKMIPDRVIQRMAEQRERTEDTILAENSRRILMRNRNAKITAAIEAKGLVINPSLVNKCCGNIPSVGVRKGEPVIYCCWCKSEVIDTTPDRAVEQWNNGTKAIVPDTKESGPTLGSLQNKLAGKI